MALVRPTDSSNVVPGVVSFIDQYEKSMTNIRYLQVRHGTVSWPGGQTFSDPTQVSHSLPKQAMASLITSGSGFGFGGPDAIFSGSPGNTSQQWSVQATTTDGSSPAGGTTLEFSLLLIIFEV